MFAMLFFATFAASREKWIQLDVVRPEFEDHALLLVRDKIAERL
jgi:hypothetical protein